MILYAIKHLPSGGYLPGYGSRRGRGGFTHDEPKVGLPPRLFGRKQDAKVALGHWLKGATSCYTSWDGDEDWSTHPKPHRKAEEMAVVEVRLTEAD